MDLTSNSDRLFENRVSKDVITTLLLKCGFSTPMSKRGRLESNEIEQFLKELPSDTNGFNSLKSVFYALCEIQ